MLLSIITINYNDKEGLNRTIDSVTSQTSRNFEWIIIDGGSKDGSKELIERIAQNPSSNIAFWCSENDKGIYNAMNKGLSHAHGDYCLFLNSGDCLYNENVLFDLSNELHSSDFIYGNQIDSVTGKRKGNFKGEQITLADFFYSSFPHQATFIKRELFEKWGGYDENYKIVSDWKFFLEMVVLHNATIKYIDKPIALFDSTGVSSCAEPGSESRIVMAELFPQRVLDDYAHFISVKEILCNPISRRLYSILYRLSVIMNKLL